MNIRVFHEPPPPEIGAALEEFEAQFRYPLGDSQSFSISHGREYLTFFAAIGAPTLVVAEHRGQVVGTFSAALRSMRFPDGTERKVAYLGDLKIAPSARGGIVLARMMETMHVSLAAPANGMAYGVVMDGTGKIPPNYTGRVGVPTFSEVGRVCILKVTTARFATQGTNRKEAGIRKRLSSFSAVEPIEWARRGFVPHGGNPALRSEMTPLFLASESAVGRLEDTQLAKRLFISPSEEIRAAHLSGFAFASAADGAALFSHAAAVCAERGIPSLFAAVPQRLAESLRAELSDEDVHFFGATVFGCGLSAAGDWWVDTAEI